MPTNGQDNTYGVTKNETDTGTVELRLRPCLQSTTIRHECFKRFKTVVALSWRFPIHPDSSRINTVLLRIMPLHHDDKSTVLLRIMPLNHDLIDLEVTRRTSQNQYASQLTQSWEPHQTAVQCAKGFYCECVWGLECSGPNLPGHSVYKVQGTNQANAAWHESCTF